MCNYYKYLYIIFLGDIQVKYYYTNFYQSYKGLTRNIIYVLNQDERLELGDFIRQLEDQRDELIERGFLEYHYTKKGTLSSRTKQHPDFKKSYWNKKDEEAIDFLKRLCYFTDFEQSIMLDPTDWQLEGIVDKMLVKIYGRFYGTFSNWLQVTLEGELTKEQIRDHMDKKRALFRKCKEAGLLGNINELPY